MNDATVRILGPLELWVAGGRLELGGGRQRALLALLALHANEVVSSDRLIDELWGASPPSTARKVLQNIVSQLRSEIGPTGPDLLVTRSPGYVLELGAEALDARRFEQLAAEAARLLADDPARARELLGEALALWRGEPLVDFAYERFAQGEIARLQELRLAALEDRIDADLALGRHAELVAELEPLVAAHPLRERLRGQLMLALYRSGRLAEALETYRAGRRALREELGLEPTAALKQLEQAILRQDESLGPPPRLPPAPLRTRRRRLLLAAVAALLVLAAALLAVALLPRGGATRVVADSLVKIDPATDKIVDVVPVGKNPGPFLAVVGRFLFVADDGGTLYRIDTRSGEVTTSGAYNASGVAGEGDAWLWVVSAGAANVVRVAPDTLESFGQIRLPRYSEAGAIAVGGGSLWVSEAGFPRAISRWSLRTLRLERRYMLPAANTPAAATFGDGAAWVADFPDELVRIDARSGRMTQITVGLGPLVPFVAFGSVWVQMVFDNTVWRIDPDTGTPEAIIPVSRNPLGLTAGAGSVWVAGECPSVVSRIDPEKNSVVATIKTGNYPRMPAVVGGFVWVGVAGEAGPGC
jgi:DNA-binding SARP family transcriptional activator/streptogramin lyase